MTSRGHALDVSAEAFGTLQPSDLELDGDLGARLQESGYLYLTGFLPREDVVHARAEILNVMAGMGRLAPDSDPLEARPSPELDLALTEAEGSASLDGVTEQCPQLQSLLYGERTMNLFGCLFGTPARAFDLTWLRAAAPGLGTVPHCDIVYMGRGSERLHTMWVPYSDISFELGGLMLLEDSLTERVQGKLAKYLCRDVDEYCSNRPLPAHVDLESKTDNKVWKGWLAKNPVSLRRNLGGRWLSAEYRMGDVLIFSHRVVHGSLDNRTDQFRLSTDSRFQPAVDPADPRFVGKGPFGHTGSAKRGRVC